MKDLALPTIVLDSIIFELQRDGGISRYWHEIASRLMNLSDDFHVHLLANENSRNAYTARILNLATSTKNTTTLSKCPSGRLRRYMDVTVEQPYRNGIWHSSYYRNPSCTMPSVCTVHDFIYEKMFPHDFRTFVHHFQKKRAVNRADHIICISDSTKKDLLHYFPNINERRCHVVHHGIGKEFQYFPSIGQDQHCKPYVVFVGRRDAHKNFFVAATAVSGIEQLTLTIVGPSLTESETRRLNAILPERYQSLQNITDTDLANLYRNAVALVYPSDYEGFGLPVLEAMASGCPVIAVRASSIPEIAGDAALLVDKPEPHRIKDCLLALLPFEHRREWINRGLKQSQRFSWDIAFTKTAEIYRLAANKTSTLKKK